MEYDHIELNRSSSAPTPFEEVQAKRKGAAAGVKNWLVVHKSGHSRMEEMGKQMIISHTGIQAQDLRVIDAELSYPSAILLRERAIVLNLEHVKAIITATQVLVPNPKDPYIASFACDLELKLSHAGATMGSDRAPDQSPSNMPPEEISDSRDNSNPLPFEFKALEVCLQSVCKSLESETSTLEEEAYPALDELSINTTRHNLKCVRVLKGRLVALSGRVQKVRDEFEHLLDDDADMAQMYLTYKLSTLQSEGLENDHDDDQLMNDADADAFESGDNRDEAGSCKSNTPSVRDLKPNVEEMELLLGAYFVQIDAVLNKLSTISEYVRNTEDYVNIVLDDLQNQLLRVIVIVNTLSLLFDAAQVVLGYFAMNLQIGVFNAKTSLPWYQVSFGLTASLCFLCFAAITTIKRKGII